MGHGNLAAAPRPIGSMKPSNVCHRGSMVPHTRVSNPLSHSSFVPAVINIWPGSPEDIFAQKASLDGT